MCVYVSKIYTVLFTYCANGSLYILLDILAEILAFAFIHTLFKCDAAYIVQWESPLSYPIRQRGGCGVVLRATGCAAGQEAALLPT